jgi:hypothetical protein
MRSCTGSSLFPKIHFYFNFAALCLCLRVAQLPSALLLLRSKPFQGTRLSAHCLPTYRRRPLRSVAGVDAEDCQAMQNMAEVLKSDLLSEPERGVGLMVRLGHSHTLTR